MAERTRKYAEYALDLGFVPILLRPGSKIPLRVGFLRTTPEEAEQTFKNIKSEHNIGILTGEASGIVVIDIEKKDLAEWEKLLSQHPKLPETLTVRTGGGGLHLYFLFDELTRPIRNGVKIKLPINEKEYAPVDIRTSGGQVLWVGDIHPETGKKYVPINGWHIDQGEVVVSKMPEWLRDEIVLAQSKIGRR
jgi:hypothetical protein